MRISDWSSDVCSSDLSGEESDILEVVNFLADFLNSDAQIKIWLTDLIADKAPILDAKGNNIFSGRFTPLMGFGGRVDDLYAAILLRVFNASARQRLTLSSAEHTSELQSLLLNSYHD